jgi:predicted butyrate kinase (DUF1464 family)
MGAYSGFLSRAKWYGGLVGLLGGRLAYLIYKLDEYYDNRSMYPTVGNGFITTTKYPTEFYDLRFQAQAFATLLGVIVVMAVADILIQTYISHRTIFYRVMTTISVLWILSMSTIFKIWKYSSDIDEFIGFGIIPVILVWGILWIIKDMKFGGTQ